jgi:hypothetical protein
VPFAPEAVPHDGDDAEFFVGHLRPRRVVALVESRTLRPVRVVVLAIRLTTTSWLATGRPRHSIGDGRTADARFVAPSEVGQVPPGATDR